MIFKPIINITTPQVCVILGRQLGNIIVHSTRTRTTSDQLNDAKINIIITTTIPIKGTMTISRRVIRHDSSEIMLPMVVIGLSRQFFLSTKAVVLPLK